VTRRPSPDPALAATIFGVLVVATFGAFFLAQRLKNAPSVVQQFKLTPFFSPNRDGRFDRAYVTFKLKHDDRVTVAVVDHRGDEVRVLADDHEIAAYTPVRFAWNGRDDDGARAADGLYRVRLTLRDQGRSVIVPRKVRLDTRAPRPLVTAVGPFRGPGPEILPLPDDAQAEVHLSAPGRRPVVRIFKTSPGRTRLVREKRLPNGAREWSWDGRTQSGRPVSPGTYLVGLETRDQAGNRGVSPRLNRRGLPVEPYGARLPGHGGITVRYLGAMPPAMPSQVGADAEFGVDARQQPWTWAIRRVGSSDVVKEGRKTSARLRVAAPGRDKSGVYLFTVHTATHATTVPFAVQARARRSVLVVLPVMTWQGRNPIDDDGDGLPNLLDRGVGVKLGRVYFGDGLPVGFARRDAPLLTWLDRNGHGYDVTTDVALAAGEGPRLEGHAGVILPSDTRWLPRPLQQRLRRYVTRGGKVATFGVDSLQRQVTISPRQRLVEPTPPATTDIFGARLRPVARLPKPTAIVEAKDDIELFAGTTGAFGPFQVVQEAGLPGNDSGALSSAVTQDPQSGRPVIAASRLGKGLVIRFPLPELPGRLSDPQVTGLLQRTWTLLSR
jgi:flagellar hook assembly protein FlgD